MNTFDATHTTQAMTAHDDVSISNVPDISHAPDIPLIDISLWRHGSADERMALAGRLDRAMQDSGFFLVSGHGIAPELAADIRAAARRFFALPAEAKAAYATHVGGRGYIAKGKEANSYYGEDADGSKPDLKESLTLGRNYTTGDAESDASWFAPNVWPNEVPELALLTSAWADAVWLLYQDLLEMLACAIGLPPTYLVERSTNAPYGFNINRYPALVDSGPVADGQFRIAPHTDWGILTILDRQVGYGGLQVETADGDWADAPFVEGALTVNIADLLARWTGDRWRSTKHRVLPPSAKDPQSELISLILFLECDMTEMITPFAAPIGGGGDYPPVVAGDYFTERAAAASVEV